MCNKIQSPGERLKETRVEILHVTQDRLADGNFSKSYISALERGIELINPKTAQKLSESINKIAEKKKIIIKQITPEYFLEDKDTQISNYVKRAKSELKSKENIEEIDTLMNEIKDFIKQYDSKIDEEEKYKIFEIAYNKYYKNWRFYDSKTYIIKCKEMASSLNKDISYLNMMLIRSVAFLGEYENIIVWGKTISSEKVQDCEAIRIINYDIAKAYKCLNKIDECINQIKSIKPKFKWTPEEKLKLEILLAECIKKNGDYTKVENMYFKLINDAINMNSTLYKIIIYTNLSDLYTITKEYNKAIGYIKKALTMEILDYNHKGEIQPVIYSIAFNTYIATNNFEKTEEFFKKTLTWAEKANNEELQIETYDKMLNYCIDNNLDEYILKIVYSIEIKITNKIITNIKIIKILFLTSWHFKEKNETFFDAIYQKIYNSIKNIEL